MQSDTLQNLFLPHSWLLPTRDIIPHRDGILFFFFVWSTFLLRSIACRLKARRSISEGKSCSAKIHGPAGLGVAAGCLKASFNVTLAAIFGAVMSSCSSGPAPLSIKMYNPETNQTLDCKASDETARTDIAVLGAAVESCAKQLEARGFVRQ